MQQSVNTQSPSNLKFNLRVVLVYTLPVVVVLGVSPIVTTSITVATLLWTFAYARAAAKRGEAMRQRQQEVATINQL
jgi:hypothetical protein